MTAMNRPVLILGAGINGAAVARDLILRGVPVMVVDQQDIACGATSRSSRLIHGGLRYLEYRDIELVRESLRERERLLKLAPRYVQPLRLTIPVTRWSGGLLNATLRFTGLHQLAISRWLQRCCSGPRGLLAVRTGLMLYDWLAGRGPLPRHGVHRTSETDPAPQIDRTRYSWRVEYSDALIAFPERFTLEMLQDAREVARSRGLPFEVLTHQRVRLTDEGRLLVEPVDRTAGGLLPECGIAEQVTTLEPALIVNATGAWGDRTLRGLGLHESELFAGTRGSHLFTHHQGLREALRGQGIYAEAADGRLVFILPCADGVLIGTTDDPFEDDPGEATASDADADYLLAMVRSVFPEIALSHADITARHAGVRPLPRVKVASTSAVPRGHSIAESSLNVSGHRVPVLTLIGGKLTTCRALAEETGDLVLQRIGLPFLRSITAGRPLPGSAWPPDENVLRELSSTTGWHPEQILAVGRLTGQDMRRMVNDAEPDGSESLSGTSLPLAFVRWSIRQEWATRLDDLIERRLMLVFEPHIVRGTLRQLADELIRAGQLDPAQKDQALQDAGSRLERFYGRKVLPLD